MLALIPARGGSKGVPGKNVKPLAGKPLIVHTIEAALSAKEITKVVVTTDCERISDIAKTAGAEVPFMRPKELAGDDASALETYLHACTELKDRGHEIDSFVVLLPTVPLRRAEQIDEAIKLFFDKKADSVISVTHASCPVQWTKRIDEKGALKPYFSEFGDTLCNRQDLEPSYVLNGAIYVFKWDLLSKKRTYYSDKTYGYMMPRCDSVDIDEPFDFEIAEFLMSRRGTA